ncbi:MAG: nuclear transport factor 2 family protein [Acidobacteriota bacterium]|nr:nuclear transport factor 2 family protein [Acidobacteriota bacterium]
MFSRLRVVKTISAASVALISIALLNSAGFSQQTPKPKPPAKSRLQVFFAELENQELNAIQGKDQSALNRILSDDFRESRPDNADKPTSREDWLREAFSRTAKSYEMRQMSVRPLSPQISIASFILSQAFERGGRSETEEHFVVDVWTNTGGGDNWRCTDRYTWKVTGLPHPMPGAKPSGK